MCLNVIYIRYRIDYNTRASLCERNEIIQLIIRLKMLFTASRIFFIHVSIDRSSFSNPFAKKSILSFGYMIRTGRSFLIVIDFVSWQLKRCKNLKCLFLKCCAQFQWIFKPNLMRPAKVIDLNERKSQV